MKEKITSKSKIPPHTPPPPNSRLETKGAEAETLWKKKWRVKENSHRVPTYHPSYNRIPPTTRPAKAKARNSTAIIKDDRIPAHHPGKGINSLFKRNKQLI